MKNLLLILFLIFVSREAFSLVDYSEDTSGFKPKAVPSAPRQKTNAPTSTIEAPKMASKKSSGPSMMEFSTQYKSQSIGLSTGDVGVSTFNFNGHIQTPYNFYLDLSYDIHSTDSLALSESASYQEGNPELKIGLNWLTFGTQADMTTVDFIFGYRAGMDESNMASTRDDKIVALETTKRFHQFVVGLGYQIDMTGAPSSSEERDIGNISKLYANLGVEVSHDIRFLLSAQQVKIASNADSTHSLMLSEDQSYAAITPRLILGIAPYVNLHLGGVFRTKRLKDIDTLTSTRLYNLDGALGNSLITGLDISL